MAMALHATPPGSVHRDRVMWVTPMRIAYRSLFGQPGTRRLGAWTLYVAIDQPFQLAVEGAAFASHWTALVAPYAPHQVRTPDRSLVQLLVEPETLAQPAVLRGLIDAPARAAATRQRILAGFAQPLPGPEEFDLRFFGRRLPPKVLDPRIAGALAQIDDCLGDAVTAERCALRSHLSFSRFTHLFTRETGSSFRRLRAWKRARSLLPKVCERSSLVDIALGAGYADSTHFSHAIRQFYGYAPRDIFAGSRRLAVVAAWPEAAIAA